MSEFQAAIVVKAVMKCPLCDAKLEGTFRELVDQRSIITSESFLRKRRALQMKIEKHFEKKKVECKVCKKPTLLELKWMEDDDEDEDTPPEA